MNVNQLKRLPGPQRRDQLLGVALAIVRERGTEDLTLCSLAQRVGITHTVAYRHFSTRAGLLIASYEQVDARQSELLSARLGQAAAQPRHIARVISETYMSCALEAGVEWHALLAAMRGNGQMAAVQRRLTERHVAICQRALAPYSSLPPEQLHLRCSGFLGAARAIADELLDGRIDQNQAVAGLTELIFSWIACTDCTTPARISSPQSRTDNRLPRASGRSPVIPMRP